MNLWEDRGYQYLWSTSAEAYLQRWVKSAGDRDEILGELRERYARAWESRRVQTGEPYARTMVYHAGVQYRRDRRRAWIEDHKARCKASGGRWKIDYERGLAGRYPPESLPILTVDAESGKECELPALQTPPPEEERERTFTRIRGDAEHEHLLATLSGIQQRLSVVRGPPEVTPRCPLHEAGCLRANLVLVGAQQTTNLMLNIAADDASSRSEDPPQRSSRPFQELILALARGGEPGQNDASGTGRQRKRRIQACILHCLWTEARHAGYQPLVDALGMRLGAIYLQLLGGDDHRRAVPGLHAWLREHQPRLHEALGCRSCPSPARNDRGPHASDPVRPAEEDES